MGKYKFIGEGFNRAVKINIMPGERYTVENEALASMDDVFKVKNKNESTFKRMIAQEEPYIQEYIAKEEGELILSSRKLGEIEVIEMDGFKKYQLGKKVLLACSSSIKIDYKFLGMKSLLSQSGSVNLIASGAGQLFIRSKGGIYKKKLYENQEYIVDNEHFLLCTTDTKYKLITNQGIYKSVAGGEGVIFNFIGPGEVWIQSGK